MTSQGTLTLAPELGIDIQDAYCNYFEVHSLDFHAICFQENGGQSNIKGPNSNSDHELLVYPRRKSTQHVPTVGGGHPGQMIKGKMKEQ